MGTGELIHSIRLATDSEAAPPVPALHALLLYTYITDQKLLAVLLEPVPVSGSFFMFSQGLSVKVIKILRHKAATPVPSLLPVVAMTIWFVVNYSTRNMSSLIKLKLTENVRFAPAKYRKGMVIIMSKQEVLKLINTMPDDITYADVLYNLYLMSNITAGLEDIESGNIHSHDEVKRIFA